MLGLLSLAETAHASVAPGDAATTGSLNWTFLGVEDQFDYLAAGESVELEYTVRVTDPESAFDETTVTVTVNGTNDGPEFTEAVPADTLALTETNDATGGDAWSGTPTLTGSIAFKDVDVTDTGHTFTVESVVPTKNATTTPDYPNGSLLGLLSLAETAHASVAPGDAATTGSLNWTFLGVEDQFDYLAAGESVELEYTVRVTDPESAFDETTVTVTVNGTNDGPEFTEAVPADTLALTETNDATGGDAWSGTPTLTGSIAFKDVDVTDTGHTFTVESVVPTKNATTTPDYPNGSLLGLLSLAETAHASVAPGDAATTGSLNWTFLGVEDQFDYLAAGESVELEYTVRVTDPESAFDETTVTVTVNGTNDGPEFTEAVPADTLALTETNDATGGDAWSGTPTLTGSIAFKDVDVTDTGHTFTVESVVPTKNATTTPDYPNGSLLGLLSLAETAHASVAPGDAATTGSLNWTFLGVEDQFDYLAAGESVELEYTVRVTDPESAFDETTVTVTVNGTNDGPEFTEAVPADTLALTETNDATGGDAWSGTPTLTGSIAFKDVDVTDTGHTFTVESVVPTKNATTTPDYPNGSLLGLLSLAETAHASVAPGDAATTGSLNWTFLGVEDQFDYLAAGESVELEYTVRVTDPESAFDETTVTVTVNGTNDGPEFTEAVPADTLALTETNDATGGDAWSGTPTLTGSIAFKDVDVTDTGHTFTVESVVPTKNATTTPDYPNGSLLGLLSLAETAHASVAPGDAATTGSLNWTFLGVEDQFDYLAAGESVELEYTVRVTDPESAFDETTVTVTVNGTNDGPEFTEAVPADTLALTETNDATGGDAWSGTPTLTGSIAFKDVDVTDTGHTFTVESVVPTKNATTTPDYPNGSLLGLLSLAETAHASVAPGDAATTGSLNWTFLGVEDQFDYLAAGESVELEYTVRVTDPESAFDETTVTVTVNGTNDGPEFTEAVPADTLALTETNDATGGDAWSGTPTLTGSIAFKDVDVTDTGHTFTVESVVPTKNATTTPDYPNGSLLGLLSLAETAHASVAPGDAATTGSLNWTFLGVEDQFDYLAAGESVELEYTVRVTDPESAFDETTVTVTVNGTNDGPEFTEAVPADTLALTETNDATGGDAWSGTPTLTGSIAFKDVDVTDTGHTFTVESVVPTKNATTTPDYPNGSLLGLLSLAETAHASVAPGDAATTGSLNWTFLGVEDQFDYLAAGESVELEYTVRVTDPESAFDETTVTVTVNGTNDGPEFTEAVPADTLALTETNDATGGDAWSGTPTLTGSIAFKDVDVTDTGHTFTVESVVPTKNATTTPDYPNGSLLGLLSLAETAHASVAPGDAATTGSLNWTFLGVEDQFDYLAAGESVELEYTVRVTDPESAFDETTVTVTVNGTNDGPVATDDTAFAGAAYFADNGHYYKFFETTGPGTTWTDAQAAASAMGGYLATLTSAGEQNFVSTNISFGGDSAAYLGGTQTPGSTITSANWNWIEGDGSTVPFSGTQPWANQGTRFAEPNDVQNFEDGQENYLMVDAAGKWNDIGIFPHENIGYLVEFDAPPAIEPVEIDLLSNDTDVDNGAILSIQSVDALSTRGATIFDNGDGTVTYFAGSAMSGLTAGQQVDDTFIYTVQDEHGATDTATVTVTLTGTGLEPPVAMADTASVGAAYFADTGHYYQYIETTTTGSGLTWTEGQAEANAAGGYLATITSAAEHQFVIDNLNFGSDRVAYVGGSDAASEGTWNWIEGVGASATTTQFWSGGATGSAVNGAYAPWTTNTNEPNNNNPDGVNTPYGGEDYLFFYVNAGFSGATFNDLTGQGDEDYGFIREYDSPPAIEPVDIDLLANDTGADTSAVLSIKSVDALSARGGAIFDNGDGTVTYFAGSAMDGLAAGEQVDDTFIYTVQDQHGATDTTTVTVTLTGTGLAAPVVHLTPIDDGSAGLVITDTSNITLANSQIEANEEESGGGAPNESGNPDVVNGIVGDLISFAPTGNFDFTGPGLDAPNTVFTSGGTYGKANIIDGDLTGSDGTYGIFAADPNAVVMTFAEETTVGSIAIYNGYANRDDGTYTLKDADGTVLGQWTIATSVTPLSSTNTGVHSIWLTFDEPVTTTELVIEYDGAPGSDVSGSIREIQVFGVPGAGEYVQGDGSVVINPGFAITDMDSTHLESATIAILDKEAGDKLGFIDTTSIIGSYDDSTGVLTLTGTATLAEYEAALQSVTGSNNGPAPAIGDRTIAFSVNDGSIDSTPVSLLVNMVPATLVQAVEDVDGGGAGLGTSSASATDGVNTILSGIDAVVDTLTGANGNDLIYGFSGNDILSGMDGNDLIFDGDGLDVMDGGNGLDTFVLANDGFVDEILNFNTDEDVIDLSEFASGSTIDAARVDPTSSTVNLTVGGTTIAQLTNVSGTDLTVDVLYDSSQLSLTVDPITA